MEGAGGAGSLLNDSLQLGSSLLNITASRTQQQQDILYITDNRVTDSQLTTSLWLNALLGLIFFLAFCVLQRSVFPQHFRFRLVSASVTVKPRDLPTTGFYSLWAWLWTAWDVNDDEIMRSSGLDAVVMIKALQMGVEIFAPLALVGCAVLLPVHYQFKGRDSSTGFNRSQLMQLTIAALPRGSDVMWLHFVLTVGYNLWVMWVLSRYFKDFVLVRQHYLSKGDDPNYWMALTQQADAEYVSKKVRKMLAEINQPGSNKPSAGGGQQPPLPELCTSPQPTERASTSTVKQGWLGSMTDKVSRLAQRMSRTNMFSRSSDSYRPYTSEASPQHSPSAVSHDGSEHRVTHVNWAAIHNTSSRATAAGLANSTTGSDGFDSSVRNSKDSSEGLGSGPGTAAGSESGGSNAGAVLSGGGKRWSSGSSGGAAAQAAVGSSEGGSATAGSSRGGADTSSGSGSSGGGAMTALDSISRKLRLSGSRNSRGGARGSAQQAQAGVAAPGGGGTPPTYQTISELHSMTTQPASSGFPGHFWPPVPKHMRTITEDSLEYRLDASLAASRPSSRGGLGGPVSGTRNSSSSGADLSPCSISAHAAALALAAQAAAGLAPGTGSTSGLLSTDGSGSSSALQGGGASGSSAGAFGSTCGPSTLSRASTAVSLPAAGVPVSGMNQPHTGLGGGTSAAEDSSSGNGGANGRAASWAANGSHAAAGREGTHLRASITSLDSIDERSSVGTCIIHHSAPSSPGIDGCSTTSSRSSSPSRSPVPDAQGADSSGNATGRDISFAGAALGGVTLQGTFAEAAMAAGSGGSSLSGSEAVEEACDTAALPPVDSSRVRLNSNSEATLRPVSQEDVSISILEGPMRSAEAAAAAAGGEDSQVSQRKQLRSHAHECSVDFSMQHLPDLSNVEVSLLEPETQEGVARMHSRSTARTSQPTEGSQGGAARWSPFANSDDIASSIAAAGVALVSHSEHWTGAAQGGASFKQTAGGQHSRAPTQQQHDSSSRRHGSGHSGGELKQAAMQLTKSHQEQQPQQQLKQPRQQQGGIHVQSEQQMNVVVAAAAHQPQQEQPSPQQQQQQQVPSQQGSQQWFSRSQQGSSNGSTSSSIRQQRLRVQQSSLHSSSEPSPASQAGIPPCWSASWQHQQQAQLRAAANPNGAGSNNVSRALSPVGGSFVTAAVAGAAIGSGQELTPVALAAAAAGGATAEAAAERLQQLLQDGADLRRCDELDARTAQHRVAYHWWKELPTEQLRKCDSLISDQQAWLDVGDRPLLAKPSVRFRKTINTTRMGPDGQEHPISVNAQHYAVLVTDVQPSCPYPELEEARLQASQLSVYYRAWTWLGYWVDRLTPRPRSWGVGAYRRYSGEHHLATDSWPFGDHIAGTSQEQQLLVPQQHHHAGRLSSDTPLGAAPASSGGLAGTPLSQARLQRRQSLLTSCQTSSEGLAGGGGLALCTAVAAAASNPLARLSQGSHLSHLSLLPDVRPEEQMQYLQQQIQWAMDKLSQDVAAGVLHPKDSERRLAKILKVQADFQEKLAASERMATISRETSVLLPAVGRTTSHLRLAVSAVGGSGAASVAMTPGAASRCSSFRSVATRGPRGPDSAVAGATVGNPDFSCGMGRAGASNTGMSFSLQPTPRSPTPHSMRASSEAGGSGGSRGRVDTSASTVAVQHQVLQHRLPPTLISSSSLQQRLQRMRVGASARLLGSTGPGLDSGDLPLHMLNSASSSCMLRPQVSGSAACTQPATLECHASAGVGDAAQGAAPQAPGPSSGGPGAAAERPAAADSGAAESATGRQTGSQALLTKQMSGELSMQQSPDQLAQSPGDDDQPTPAAEAAALPPRYSRQQRSSPSSPRATGDALRRSSNCNSDSASTPAADGRRDSFDSATSQHSSATKRPVVHFSKPFPPDSPRASAVAGSAALSPRNLSALTSQGSGSRAVSGVITHGAPGRSLRPAGLQTQRTESGSSSNRLPPAVPSSTGGSSTSSLPPAGLHTMSLGSSGGGAPASSSEGGAHLHLMPPLPVPGRGKSGRIAAQFERQQNSSQQHQQRGSSPDHLAVIIPPCIQMPPSRSGTPGVASGGAQPAPLVTHASMSSLHVPPQPWGLPPDAALLNTSFGSSPLGILGPWGSGSKGFRAATTGGMGGQACTQQQSQQAFHRWSAGGIAEPRSHATGAQAALTGPVRVTSPLLSEPELTPAVTAGYELGLLSKSPAQSRPVSTTNDTTTAAVVVQNAAMAAALGRGPTAHELFLEDIVSSRQPGFMPIPPTVRGWARVRWAYRTRVLLDLPKRESYDIVSATFSRLFPGDFDRAIPVINHKGVDKLLLQWEAAVAALERAELKKRRTGREPLRLSGTCGSTFGFCAESMGCSCCSCTAGCLAQPACLPERSTVKIIPELQDTIQSLEKQIEQARRKAFSSAFTPSWFVLFKSQSAAMMAASTRIYAHDNTKFQVHPAPGPEEVNWQHIWMSGLERDLRTAFTWPLTLAVVLFPITLVTSAASRLEYVFCPTGSQDNPTFYWQWYCSGREQGSSLQSFMRAFITGWLPSLLLNLWLAMIMPRLVYLLVQMEGNCFSLSALERRIGAIFFYWDVYNMFLQGTIGSTFFQQVHSIIQSPEKLPTILGAALPDSSNFFMQFIAMRALFLIWLRLCVPHGGVWQNWLHYCCCPSLCCSTCNTERDKSLTYGPRTPRYGFEMGHMLLMYLIAMAFSIVSPLLLPFSVVWFAFAWLAWRHNLSYVYQRKYESGGMMWMFLFSRIVMCLVIGQLFTFCVLVVRGAYWQAFLIIAFMPALTLRYYRYCQARYAKGVEYGVPLDVAHKAARARVPALAYIPPPLQDRSWGWYPEWQKIWEGWGMPTYAAA